MSAFNPKLTITNRMTAAITQIERECGFLEAAKLSDDWMRDMGNKALIKEAHHMTHIEGARLTLDQAELLWNGEIVPEADPGNYRRIQNYVANSSTGEVIYTPPSAVEAPIMMSEMVKWLNADLEIHPGC